MRGGEERIGWDRKDLSVMAAETQDSRMRGKKIVSTKMWWIILRSCEILSKRRLVYFFVRELVLDIHFMRRRKLVK